ncbi:MAG: PsbP-related protein [Candidatus Paceibacterota bacterium]|jgi:hypothetical protein
MNTTKGFVVPLFLIIIAVLLAGGGAYVYTQTKQGSEPVATTSDAPQTQNLKTYVSTAYGISFTYPATWTVSDSGDGPVLTPAADSGEHAITFRVSSVPKGATLNINCPSAGNEAVNSLVDSFHSVACENLETQSGVPYTKLITAEQSTAQSYRGRILSIYFLAPEQSVTLRTLMDVGETMPETLFAVVQSFAFNTPTLPAIVAPAPKENETTPPTPISGDTNNWKTYRSDLYHFSFQYPDGWNVRKTSSVLLADRFLLESEGGEAITVSPRQHFSKIMLSSRNGDILSYDSLQDAWMPETSSTVIQNSQLKNHFITLPAAIYGATWDIYSYDAQNRQFTSVDGTQIQPLYYTASGYPVYEFDRQNGDTTTFYFIVPLPNGSAVYVYYFGGTVLSGLEKVVKTIAAI